MHYLASLGLEGSETEYLVARGPFGVLGGSILSVMLIYFAFQGICLQPEVWGAWKTRFLVTRGAFGVLEVQF